MKKHLQTLAIIIISTFAVVGVVSAATTISTSISTGGDLSVTGTTTLIGNVVIGNATNPDPNSLLTIQGIDENNYLNFRNSNDNFNSFYISSDDISSDQFGTTIFYANAEEGVGFSTTASGGGNTLSVALASGGQRFTISDGSGDILAVENGQQLNIGRAARVAGDLTVEGKINGVKVYRALLSQSGTDAPVATVLENSLGGTVVWTRDDVGRYTATLSGAFPLDKTISYVASPFAGGPVWLASFRTTDGNGVELNTAVEQDGAFSNSDDFSGRLSVQILVYP